MDSRDEAMIDERLEALERFRHDFEQRWQAAFPNGDHVTHCSYHQLMIEDIRDRKMLIKAVKEKTVAGLVWAGMIAVGLACWKYFLSLVSTRGG